MSIGIVEIPEERVPHAGRLPPAVLHFAVSALLWREAVCHRICQVLLRELCSLLDEHVAGIQSPGPRPKRELALVDVRRLQLMSRRVESLWIDRADGHRRSDLLVGGEDCPGGIAEHPDGLEQGAP